MKKFYVLNLFLCCLFVQQSFSQTRYIDEVFTDDQITVTTNVEYGINMSVFEQIFVPGIDVPIPDTLMADIYMPDPTIDTETERPVVFLMATALLPRFVINCFGGKEDLKTTYIASELAKRGYVVMAIDTRLGANFFAPTTDAFLQSLVDLALQQSVDIRTAARFIRNDVAANGNTFGVNVDQFIHWEPTIGSTPKSLLTTTEAEFQTANFFVLNENDSLVNVVDLEKNGGLFGERPGMDAAGNVSNIVNFPEFIEDYPFDLLIGNHGSAIDSTNIQAGETPMITYLNRNNTTATTELTAVVVPSTGQFCCNAITGQVMQRQSDQLGNVDIWKGVEFTDPVANTRAVYPADPSVGEIEGLIVLDGPDGNENPTIFWDTTTCIAVGASIGNPDLNAMTSAGFPGATTEVGMAAIDQIIRYWTPRACVLFGWDCVESVISSTENISVAANNLTVSPNPSAGNFTFESAPEHQMESIQIFNVSGALMYETKVENTQFTMNDIGLSGGMYFAKIRFEDGIATKKIMVEK